jgi:hypothetical protein
MTARALTVICLDGLIWLWNVVTDARMTRVLLAVLGLPCVGAWLAGGEWSGIWTQINASAAATVLLKNRTNIVTTLAFSGVPSVYDQQTCCRLAGADVCTNSTLVADAHNKILWFAQPWHTSHLWRPFSYSIKEGVVMLTHETEWYQWTECPLD